jgi:transcription initiation factor TFIIIB Brf1 subunit/transcription initiation factor TFIIB
MEQMLSLFHNCPKDVKTKGRLVTDQARGEIFCQECGRVLKERIVTQENVKND